jgi:hypothetical protein
LGWPYRWIGAYSTGQTIPSCPIKKGLECLQQEKLTSRLVLSVACIIKLLRSS